MAEQPTSVAVDERFKQMEQRMDTMQSELEALKDGLRQKTNIINRLNEEIENLKKRMHLNEEVDEEQAKQLREREERELKEEMDRMPIPDLTVKKEADEVNDAEPANVKPKYKGYLLLWSGSSGYKNETYNKIQLMNLTKYAETNGKQKPYIFHLQTMEKSLFKKSIQFTSTFDRHWFGCDAVTNNEWMPKYISNAIDKLNYNPMNNPYIKKWTSNVSSLQQKWNLKKLSSFTKNLNFEAKEKQIETPPAKTDEQTATKDEQESKSKDDSDDKVADVVFDVNKNYSMIFRCGGVYAYNKQRCADCDLTIFAHLHDANVINGYTLNLPSLPVATSLTSTVYNHHNGVLYVIAGDTDHDDVSCDMYQLNLNNMDKCEWKRCSVKLYNARKSVCSCLIDARNIMVMGGKSKSGEKLSSVELFVNTANNVDIEINRYRTTKLLASLCLPRSASGSLLFDASDKRVIIGGGWAGWSDMNDDTKRTVEFWDAHKNQWTLFPYKTNYEHQFSPILWNDKYGNGINGGNPNIVYIAGDCVGIDSKSVLGSIEWIDIRENKADQKWNTFANETNMLQMFSLQNVDEKIWRSRSLLIA